MLVAACCTALAMPLLAAFLLFDCRDEVAAARTPPEAPAGPSSAKEVR